MVKVIYHSYWGVYSAFLMAALQVGIIDENTVESRDFLVKYWRFCRLYGQQYGNLIYVGIDSQLREVYCIGCKKHSNIVLKAQTCMNEIFEIGDELFYVDAKGLDGFIPKVISAMRSRPYFEKAAFTLLSYWVRKTIRRCMESRQLKKMSEGDMG